MLVSCVCCTYGRPQLLVEAVESFLRQTYEPREMIILDDAGQYQGLRLPWPNVRLVSLRHRFRTLGEKRNACAALASPESQAYAVWDDDDIYLPHHLAVAMNLLLDSDWVIPGRVAVWDGRRAKIKGNSWLYHGGWVYRRDAFVRVGGYPIMQSGQDQGLAHRFRKARARVKRHAEVTYLYRWGGTGSPHLSALGRGDPGYVEFGRRVSLEPVQSLVPAWTRDWGHELAQGQEAGSATA